MTNQDFFEIKYETTSYTTIGNEIKVNICFHSSDNRILKPHFNNINEDIAVINEDGIVKGIKEGVAAFQAWIIFAGRKYSFEFYVTIVSEELCEELKFILKNHNSNCYTKASLPIGAGRPEYYMDIVGSVSNLIFNERLNIERRYQKLQENNSLNHEDAIKSVEFVTVHYTGNMRKGAYGSNNAHYFTTNDKVSIHYVTGTDNGYGYKAFACLSEDIVGHHASDLAQGECTWLKTNVKATNNQKPVISVKDGYFTINNIKTDIEIPQRDDGIEVINDTFMYEGRKLSTINKLGLSYRIVNGYYEIPKTWWGHQSYGKTLCNIGGNRNSIGIEVCVDRGIDVYYNFQMTAWLVADIIVRHNLGIERVLGHHSFSGKNCPQPLLENNAELWYIFIKQVEAFKEYIEKYNNLNLKFTPINNFEIVKNINLHHEISGILLQDNKPHCLLGMYTIGDKQIILPTAINSNLLNKTTNQELD